MSSTLFSVQNTHLQKIQPDILGFGITTFVDQIQFAENDVLRRIREEWWERYRHQVRYKDITKVTTLELESNKLTDAQWKRCVVYKTLAEYIYPILSKFKDPDGGDGKDTFQNKMDFYRQKYSEEFQAVLRDGVEYDEDSSGTIQASEKEPIHMLRLQR